MRLAIIGAGISGLGAAWALSAAGHDLTVFEAADTLGGHAASLDVTVDHRGRAVTVPVDPAYDIYCPQTYPRFAALLHTLGAPTAPRPFTYTYETVGRDGRVDWQVRMPVLASLRNARQLLRAGQRRFVAAAMRVGRRVDRFAASNDPGGVLASGPRASWAELLADAAVPDDLVHRFFLPAFARPWGVRPGDVARMPAAIVAGWTAAHRTLTPRPLPWRWTVGGARVHVALLADALRARGVRLRVGAPVARVASVGDALGVRVHGQTHQFDHVVVATNARQALALLGAPTPEHRAALGAFRYQHNRVVVHGDVRLVPSDRRDWSYFNVRYDPAPDETYNSIWFGIDAGVPVFATNHRVLPFAPHRVYAERTFAQPIFDGRTAWARAALDRLQGIGGLWFCGVYAHGTGHHEDGLVMAQRVASRLGAARSGREVA